MPNPPVSAQLGRRELAVGGETWPATVTVRFFAFGAVLVVWSLELPVGLPLAELGQLSVAVEQPDLGEQHGAWAAQDAAAALRAAGVCLDPPIAEPERLLLHVIHRFDTALTAVDLLAHPALPALMMGDGGEVSGQVLDELRRGALSYSSRDLVVVGYDAALVYDSENASDIAALLEFALVQVHELDWYDQQLDLRLGDAGATIEAEQRRRGDWLGLRRSPHERLRQELLLEHVELMRVLEQVTAAVKVTDDLYYASVYREAMRVFRAEELIEATDRKLELMFRTYSMLADEADTHTSHRLEWIIILLILFEIVMSLADRVL